MVLYGILPLLAFLCFYMMLSLNSPDYVLLDVFKDEAVSSCHKDSKIRSKACSALHTQQRTHNYNSDASCQISFKQQVQDTDRNRTLALNKSVIFVIDFALKFSYSAKKKNPQIPSLKHML